MMEYDFGVIRLLRKKKNFTILELAEKSGLTFPTIVSIENNKSVPSLNSLDQIARTLDMTAIGLLSACQRCNALKSLAQAYGKVVPRLPPEICRMAAFGDIKMHRVKAAAGTETAADYEHGNVFELSYVLEGNIEVVMKDDTYQLSQNETMFFDGCAAHFYRCLSESEFLAIHIPKSQFNIADLLKQRSPG